MAKMFLFICDILAVPGCLVPGVVGGSQPQLLVHLGQGIHHQHGSLLELWLNLFYPYLINKPKYHKTILLVVYALGQDEPGAHNVQVGHQLLQLFVVSSLQSQT